MLNILKIYAKALGVFLAALLVSAVLLEELFYGVIIIGPILILWFIYQQIRAYLDFRDATFVEVILWCRSNERHYHRPYCPKVIGKDGNLRQFSNTVEAEKEGYGKCNVCFSKKKEDRASFEDSEPLAERGSVLEKARVQFREPNEEDIESANPTGLPEGNTLLASLKSLKAQGKLKPGAKLRVILNRDDAKEEVAGPRAEYFTEVFDEETYAKAKPHFEKALAEFAAAGKSLKEFIRFTVDNFGENIVPYLKRFHREIKTAHTVEAMGEAEKTLAERETHGTVMEECETIIVDIPKATVGIPLKPKRPGKPKELKMVGLTTYGLQAKAHWEKYRPKMVKKLKRMGVYREALLTAQETAKKVQMSHIQAGNRSGMELEMAREAALRFIRLPDEREVPNLDPDLMPWLTEED